MRSGIAIAGMLVLASGIATVAQAADLVQPVAPQAARVYIVSPKDGETVGQDVRVVFGVEGIALAPASGGKSGTGHHHLLIDQSELPLPSQPIPDNEFSRHFGQAQTETTIKLAPGKHTLQLDFGDGRHMQFDPPIISEMVTINVK